RPLDRAGAGRRERRGRRLAGQCLGEERDLAWVPVRQDRAGGERPTLRLSRQRHLRAPALRPGGRRASGARRLGGAGGCLSRPGGAALFDLGRDRVYRREGEQPLESPAGAVLVPGTRPVRSGSGAREGISLYAPVIVKYRDERTDAAVRLEELLR